MDYYVCAWSRKIPLLQVKSQPLYPTYPHIMLGNSEFYNLHESIWWSIFSAICSTNTLLSQNNTNCLKNSFNTIRCEHCKVSKSLQCINCSALDSRCYAEWALTNTFDKLAMGLRSGKFSGQGNTAKSSLCSWNHLYTTCAVWQNTWSS